MSVFSQVASIQARMQAREYRLNRPHDVASRLQLTLDAVGAALKANCREESLSLAKRLEQMSLSLVDAIEDMYKPIELDEPADDVVAVSVDGHPYR
jgi:hypothetical protein